MLHDFGGIWGPFWDGYTPQDMYIIIKSIRRIWTLYTRQEFLEMDGHGFEFRVWW
jgi:hypothetical protein